MGTLKKQLIWYILAFMMVFAVLFYCQTKKAMVYKTKAKTLENTISTLNQQTKTKILRLNDSVEVKQAEVNSLEITNRNLQSLYGEMLKASETKAKDVKVLTKIETVTVGKDTVYCLVDSFGGLHAQWVDPYIDIKVDVDSSRKAAIDYAIKDSLTVINYEKKHSILFGLIKWKSYEGCKVITHNPKANPATVISCSIIK